MVVKLNCYARNFDVEENVYVPTKSTNLFLRRLRLETMRTRGRITERSEAMRVMRDLIWL
jgi:methylase of polypeptide subunit release factors